MSSLNISQDELKSLEQARQRLMTLIASINSMKEMLYRSDPLPPPATLDKQNFILAKNIESLIGITKDNADLFSRIVVHPSTNFPGREYEHVLQQLLRKKLEPDVEASVEAARDAAAAAGIGPDRFVAAAADDAGAGGRRGNKGGASAGNHRGYDSESDDDEEYGGPEDDDDFADEDGDSGQKEPLGLGDVWHSIRGWTVDRMNTFGAVEEPKMFTPEERAMGIDKVRTGLRRNLAALEPDDAEAEEDDDDDEEDDDEARNQLSTTLQSQQQQQQQNHTQLHQTRHDYHQQALQNPSMDTEYLLWFAARGDLNLPLTIDRLSDKWEQGRRIVAARR